MSEQTGSYPMISEKNWWTIRDRFKASMPAIVSPNYIKTLLTMSSDNSAISNVISPLKRMGIIDDENKPTALANDWRLDDKYKSACNKIIESVYPTELLDLFPDTNVERTIARNWFMGQGVGQGAADKMLALFILLKSGEIKEKNSKKLKKDSTTTKTSAKQKKDGPDVDEKVAAQGSTVTEDKADSIKRPNLHIDIQIHISPDASFEQIDAIFASMSKHLYGDNNG